MAEFSSCCALCGNMVWETTPSFRSWCKHYRILYSNPTGVWISGVGVRRFHDGMPWIVPSDYNARWDDADINQHQVEINIMTQNPPIHDRYGFPFHEACWSLLNKAYYPESIPLARLLEACLSLPYIDFTRGVSWAHHFGGLNGIGYRYYDPWERNFYPQSFLHFTAHKQLARISPFNVPVIQRILEEEPQIPPERKNPSYAATTTKWEDCFDCLPLEMLIEIAVRLDTVDFLRLRQASKAFVSIFSSQLFWASRFSAGGERFWCFEARESKGARDWRWLYRRTNHADKDPKFQNRIGLWRLIQPIKDILHLRPNGPSDLSMGRPNMPGLRWMQVAGNIEQNLCGVSRNPFTRCRQFHLQCTSIPDLLSHIAFSVIQLGDTSFVAGMRLVPSVGAAIQLGYRAEGRELFFNLTALKGFKLAVGPRGIQAIQVITSEMIVSQWFGYPSHVPITARLAVLRSITALEVGFDGYKLVSLAAAGALPSDIQTTVGEIMPPLRDTAIWYPEIPNFHLHLDDYFSKYDDPPSLKYQPLCWNLFGGRDGIHLRSITGISVLVQDILIGIKFQYKEYEGPINGGRSMLGLDRFEPNGTGHSNQVIRFPIDGLGGEIIKAVEVSLFDVSKDATSFFKAGRLASFKITTNRGRQCYFGRSQTETDKLTRRYLHVPLGATIVGFYSVSLDVCGLYNLGVISQTIR